MYLHGDAGFKYIHVHTLTDDKVDDMIFMALIMGVAT